LNTRYVQRSLILLNMPFQRHSTVAHAAWHDLRHSLQEEAVSALRGTATRVERNGRIYWYDSYRIGTEVHKVYIGEDSEGLRDRLAQAAKLREHREEKRRARARLIRILRAEGFMGVDAATGSLLAALAGAGVFRLGGTLVGTHAFRLYEGVLGVRYAFDQTAQTGDVDIAAFERLSLALGDTVSQPLQTVLRDFAFEPVPTLNPGQVWRWRQTRADLQVEFLTPSFEAEEGLRPLAALGVHAQALHFLNFALAEPIQAPVTYRRGVLVQIPRPERFAIHKLIVADRRRDGPDSLKAVKDRLQAAFLIEVLAEDRPDDLLEAWETARSAGPRWRERLDRSLGRLPDTRRRMEQLA
jgi:hypothetical protein